MCPEAAARKRRLDRLRFRKRYAQALVRERHLKQQRARYAADALYAARKTYQNRVRRRAAATAADQELLRRLGA